MFVALHEFLAEWSDRRRSSDAQFLPKVIRTFTLTLVPLQADHLPSFTPANKKENICHP
jgi:hypothetical protein